MTALDTLKLATDLVEAGMSRQQADATSRAIGAAMHDTLATKQDLKLLEASLRQEIGDLRQEFGTLQREFGTLRQEFRALEEATEQKLKLLEASLRAEIEKAQHNMTVRMIAILGVGLAVLRLSL